LRLHENVFIGVKMKHYYYFEKKFSLEGSIFFFYFFFGNVFVTCYLAL